MDTPAFSVSPSGAAFDALRLRVLRAFCVAVSVGALLGLLVWSGLLGTPAGMAPTLLRWPLLAAYALLAVVGLAGALLPPASAARTLPMVAVCSLMAVGATAAFSGWGLAMPGLVFFGLVVCVVWAVGEASAAITSSVLALLILGGLGAAEWQGWLHSGPDAAPGPTPHTLPWAMRLGAQLASVAAGTLMGRALAQLLAAQWQSVHVRERRFQSLLGIAAAAYWETDAQLRLRRVVRRDVHGHFQPAASAQGRRPWALAQLQFDGDGADALRAAMEGREPIRDLPCRWQRSGGGERHLLVSGQPRLEADGRFAGYWGVARDITAEHRAQQALQTTERRYHDLFVRLPTPLVLHRRGQIVDANPAAAQLLGYASVPRMLGHDLLAEHLQGQDRDLMIARVLQLEQMPMGAALPPIALRLHNAHGAMLQVRAIAAHANAEGAPAVLSILIDETAALAATQAQHQAEAQFAQVLSTSPDIITLTDLANGRYLMVNEAFCRMTGYAADEVVGRTDDELGLWRDGAERERLLQLLTQSKGQVQDVTVDFVTKYGQVVPLLVSASRFERDGGQRLVVNARDVADVDRLRLEREAILANASVGIAFTRERRFELVNPHFEQLYGWGPGALVGQTTRVVWSSEDELDQISREISPALRRGQPVEIERLGTRRDGSRFLVRLRAKALDPLHPGAQGTIWIAEDVTRQRRDEQALARARDEAEAASRAKSAFLANTSHEIRTPLNGLLGLARLARQPGLAAQRQRDYLEQIAESAEALSMIISDILDLSKIEAGRLEVESVPFDLRELLHALQQAYAALAAGHGLAFSVEIDRALPARVSGDAMRVRQILANYLHNALKFTSSGSIRLVVQWRAADSVARFEVHDTGPGIDEATQQRLFKPFNQGDESTGRRHGGTGLGLSICRQLATLMGGTVGVLSAAGRGSCFWTELPLPADDGPARNEPEDADNARLLQGARVLLAEDNAVNMMIASAMLEQWGLLVDQAEDGPQALELVARRAAEGRPVQVVLMDVQMPGMSGLEVTAALRQRWDARTLPIVALTAAALVSEREKALAIGMNDFVTKPIDPPRLKRALARVLAPTVNAG